jgi:hypothetical protein
MLIKKNQYKLLDQICCNSLGTRSNYIARVIKEIVSLSADGVKARF